MKDLVNRVTAAAIAGQLKMVQLRERLEQKVAPTPAARRIMHVSSMATFTALMLVSSAAIAGPDDGIAGMTNQAAEQANAIRKDIGYFCMLLGLLGGITGVIKLIQKGKEGETSQVKGSHIVIPLFGGVLLGSIGVVMAKVGQSVGMQDSDYGSIPGN